MLVTSGSVAVCDRRLAPLLGEPRSANPRLGHSTVNRLESEGAGRQPTLGLETSLAAIQFSSGSTGHPKAVALTHENMLSNAETILEALPVSAAERSGVSWLPLYHDGSRRMLALGGGRPIPLDSDFA